MSRKVRVNFSLDNNHSLNDFPIDLYSGLTSGDTTNLVYANIVEQDVPFDLEFEDSDLVINTNLSDPQHPYCFLRISSEGCYDQTIKLEVPRVDCEMCLQVAEIVPPTPTPQPTSIPPTPIPPTPGPTSPPQPTSTNIPLPTATEEPGATPYPSATPTSTPTPTATVVPPTPTPTPAPPTPKICYFVFVPDSINTTGYGLDYTVNGQITLTRFSNIQSTPTTYDGVVGEVYGVCSESYPLYYDFDFGGGAITDPAGVERPPNGGSCLSNGNCAYISPTPNPLSTIDIEITGYYGVVGYSNVQYVASFTNEGRTRSLAAGPNNSCVSGCMDAANLNVVDGTTVFISLSKMLPTQETSDAGSVSVNVFGSGTINGQNPVIFQSGEIIANYGWQVTGVDETTTISVEIYEG